MQALFEDRLIGQGPIKTWIIIFRELPASLWREYYSIRGDQIMKNWKTAGLILGGILATFFLPMLTQPLLEFCYRTFGIILTGPLGDSGYLNIPSLIIYFLIGVCVALVVKKNAMRIAMLAGLLGFIANFFIQGQFESFLRIGGWPADQINQVLTFGIEYAVIMALGMISLPAAGAYLTQHFVNKPA